jgi:predicted nucleic acid-binding Zn ribbon protein
MERAARVIKNSKYSRQILTEDDIARAIWPVAVGKAIAAHTLRVKMVRATLVVEVEDAIWQKQLFTLSRQILDRLRVVSGSNSIERIEFRVGAPRREPQRAITRQSAAAPALPFDDEAESIQDAVLKKVYRLSRKRASA